LQAVVLEGKYWKRKLAAVTAEYKKWRMFYRNRIMGWSSRDGTDMVCISWLLSDNSKYYRPGVKTSAGGGISHSSGNLKYLRPPHSTEI
jgi:hypothetical protein